MVTRCILKRMFVALEMPQHTREEIAGSIVRAQSMFRGISWVKPDNMHLTLKFLGDVDERNEKGIIEKLELLSVRHMPFEVSYGGFGHFGRAGSISAIWIGVTEETGALVSLAKDIESAASQLGIEPETKPFSPHLTLGRVKNPAMLPPWEAIRSSLQPWEGKVSHLWFSLYKSTLTPSGPIYECQVRLKLKTSR